MLVTVELGATIPNGEYGNIRPTIRIAEIDTEQDIDAQIAKSLEAATKVFAAIDGEIVSLVDEAAASASGVPKLRDRVQRLEQAVRALGDVQTKPDFKQAIIKK